MPSGELQFVNTESSNTKSLPKSGQVSGEEWNTEYSINSVTNEAKKHVLILTWLHIDCDSQDK